MKTLRLRNKKAISIFQLLKKKWRGLLKILLIFHIYIFIIKNKELQKNTHSAMYYFFYPLVVNFVSFYEWKVESRSVLKFIIVVIWLVGCMCGNIPSFNRTFYRIFKMNLREVNAKKRIYPEKILFYLI